MQIHPLKVTQIPYCVYFFLCPFQFPVAREVPHISTINAFQHLWPGTPNTAARYSDWLDIQNSNQTAPILIDWTNSSRTDNICWCEAVEFAWSRVLLNVQP
ncbi:hypothetical protein AVEN_134223-1 [Araneus ventricosus]|uniref:Uncharacterized protein n=1 Tax=Araneus ventricosus TaxID=182803 RepID=A0A4Y2ELP3_ARAVE|nr:hypothetical protein AVEN_134223-1 [Araneus ventricosus]